MASLNISKQLPVSIAVVDEPEIASSRHRADLQSSYLPKVRSGQNLRSSRTKAKAVSQLLKVNSRQIPVSRVDENRVSSGRSVENSDLSSSTVQVGVSTPSAVRLSTGTGTGVDYSGHSSGNDVVISLQDVNTVTTPGPQTLSEKTVLSRPNTEDQSGHHATYAQPPDRTNVQSSKAKHPQTDDGSDHTDEVLEVWSEWGACSVSCGTGTQERSRTCGPNCQQVESRECYLDSCHGIMRGVNFSDLNVQQDFRINDPSFNLSGVPKQTFLDTEVDACAMWSSCKDEYLQRYMAHLTELANCPCFYPFNLEHNNNVWDPNRRRYYQWVAVNSTEEKLAVYRPGAYRCIRSLLFPRAATLAAQVCCYSDDRKLITRGKNAGTPNIISPQISWELHYKIDILPWVICKGDWTRYNRVLPPNNLLGCSENPDEETVLEEAREARDY